MAMRAVAKSGGAAFSRSACLKLGLAICLTLPPPIKASQGDYLTEDEAARIRDIQALIPRTQEYLAVAEARVTEIGRRMGKVYDIKAPGRKEKKPKKEKGRDASRAEPENPLIFYSLSDLVNAISQSLRATMTNIDERFQYRRAEPKDLESSLKSLDEFTTQDFSLLDDLEEKARNDQDVVLWGTVRNLRQELERARDGTKEGLRILEGSQKEIKR
ncbi:MAG: hypothetical protein HY644_11685 [Acidobacteria bacterium]|nr:hypothetical protein [Acidobacteriota bacterium]